MSNIVNGIDMDKVKNLSKEDIEKEIDNDVLDKLKFLGYGNPEKIPLVRYDLVKDKIPSSDLERQRKLFMSLYGMDECRKKGWVK